MMILVESGPALSLMSATYGHALLEFRSDSCKKIQLTVFKHIKICGILDPMKRYAWDIHFRMALLYIKIDTKQQ